MKQPYEVAMKAKGRAIERAITATESAVYKLADGPYCYATNRMVAEIAGLRSPEEASQCLKTLRERGVLRLYDWRDGLSVRYHLILAHPQAEEAMENHYAIVSDPKPFLRVVCI